MATYTDRDKALRAVCEFCAICPAEKQTPEDCEINISLREKLAPADVKPVVRGEWKTGFSGNEWYCYCSNCKTEWYEDDLLMGGNEFPNFCPNCGADMRGGRI